MKRRLFLKAGLTAGGFFLFQNFSFNLFSNTYAEARESFEVTKTEEEWRRILSEEQFFVLREEGTERPFKNKYWDHKAEGIYACAGCDLPLFSSETKYDSKTGWPSFWEPVEENNVRTKTDWKLLYPRTEVHCRRCGGHLGHIFKDGPPPTRLRYCINSAALKFVASE